MVLTCAHCGQKNRVPAARVGDAPRCGKCHESVALSSPLDVTSTATFDEIVSTAQVPVLVDFWAPWCGPCRMAAPHVAKTAELMAGKAIVLKVNTDDLPELGARYRVQGIPNFAVFKDGAVVEQNAGIRPHQLLVRSLEAAA